MSVVEPGVVLGTANVVSKVWHTKGWGWIARDITGAEYAQRVPRWASRDVALWRSHCPSGLGGCPWPEDPA